MPLSAGLAQVGRAAVVEAGRRVDDAVELESPGGGRVGRFAHKITPQGSGRRAPSTVYWQKLIFISPEPPADGNAIVKTDSIGN